MRSHQVFHPTGLINVTLDNTFKLTKYLGSGYSGDVYKAIVLKPWKDLNPGDFVALKIYKEFLLKDKSSVLRMQREAEFGQSVNYPNLLKVYGLIRTRSQGKSIRALVMEFLDGETLGSWIRSHRSIDFDQICDISKQLFQALNCIHKQGYIHRDVKPVNIFVIGVKSKLKFVQIKLMDFGIIKPALGGNITASNEFVGTLGYASPEFLFGQEYDHRTDLYSAGAVMYELIYGKPIFHNIKRFSNLVVAVQDVEPVFQHHSNVKSMDDVVVLELVRCLLSKDPRKRFSSCEKVIEVLDRNWKEYSAWWLSRFPFIYSNNLEFTMDAFWSSGSTRNKIRIIREIMSQCDSGSIPIMKFWLDLLAKTMWGNRNRKILSRLRKEMDFSRPVRDFLVRYIYSGQDVRRKLIRWLEGALSYNIDKYEGIRALTYVCSHEESNLETQALIKDRILYLRLTSARG